MIRTLDPIQDKAKLKFCTVTQCFPLMVVNQSASQHNIGLCAIQTWEEKVSSLAEKKTSPYFMQENFPVGETSRCQKKAYLVNCVSEHKTLFR